jgi:YHS domain-containing protein
MLLVRQEGLMAATEQDPVCGMDVAPERTPNLPLEVDGKTHWYSGKGCMLHFRDPT